MNPKGILLINKTKGTLSFGLVSLLRRLTKEKTIGHAGTLDPFATGLMVLLIGREYTKQSNDFLTSDKQYQATIYLGIGTDSYDIDGTIVERSDKVPTLAELESTLSLFQGEILQVPPMFSAKKVAGKKLYELARKGVSIEREAVKVNVKIELLRYNYPEVEICVDCSKGTYIRSLAYDIAKALGTCGHLSSLTRLRSGQFHLKDAIPQSALVSGIDLKPYLHSSK